MTQETFNRLTEAIDELVAVVGRYAQIHNCTLISEKDAEAICADDICQLAKEVAEAYKIIEIEAEG